MSDPVLETLTRIREQPAVYIGRRSAEALFLFLAGYVTAVQNHTALDLSRYQAFIDGLYAKYGYGDGGHSWAWVLGQVAGGDAAGLDLFFTELTTFEQQPITPDSGT